MMGRICAVSSCDDWAYKCTAENELAKLYGSFDPTDTRSRHQLKTCKLEAPTVINCLSVPIGDEDDTYGARIEPQITDPYLELKL